MIWNMQKRRTIAKQFGIVLMALGGSLLFGSAMIGPALDPPINFEKPAMIWLAVIGVGLLIVLLNRRER